MTENNPENRSKGWHRPHPRRDFCGRGGILHFHRRRTRRREEDQGRRRPSAGRLTDGTGGKIAEAGIVDTCSHAPAACSTASNVSLNSWNSTIRPLEVSACKQPLGDRFPLVLERAGLNRLARGAVPVAARSADRPRPGADRHAPTRPRGSHRPARSCAPCPSRPSRPTTAPATVGARPSGGAALRHRGCE